MTDELKKKLISIVSDYNEKNKLSEKVIMIWADLEGTVCYFRGKGGNYGGVHRVEISSLGPFVSLYRWAEEKEIVSIHSETDKYLMIYNSK
jgi:hypothetical protein